MQMQNATTTAQARKECIGCVDCKGLCRDLLDLAFLPQMVLKGSAATR